MPARRALPLLLLLAGCPRADGTFVDASVELDAGIDAGAPDAGPPALEWQLTITTVDAGVLVLEGLDAGFTTEPVQAITLTATAGLDDVRVRVMDWTDAVVASDDESSNDGGFTYRIVFLQPLKSGRSYSLLIDSESHDTFADERGGQHDEVRVPFRVSGEVQAEPGAPLKKKRKKK